MNQAVSTPCRAFVRGSLGSAARWTWCTAALVLLALNGPAPALAQAEAADAAEAAGLDADTDDATPAADPPGRVGRVNWTEGEVTLRQPPEPDKDAESIESPRNWPVTSGDSLVTGAGARTEVSVGSTLLRLDEGTRVHVVRLDDDAMVLRVVNGSLALRIRHDELARGIEVLAADARIVPRGAGLFRIDAGERSVSATAWRSPLQVENHGHAFTLTSGQRADFGNTGGWYRLTTPESDRFAAWAMKQNEPQPEIAEVSPEMTGAQDLVEHGDWSDHPEYGRVWAPRVVAAGWAPYRFGHWAWVRPWGWTWVDAAPWGFAPFHYGRWFLWGQRWVWAPGSWVARPAYAPAVVGWFGTPGVSVSVSFGGPRVGWFPLGPREIYAPYFRCTPRYVRHFNHTHVPRIERAELYIGGGRRVVHAPPHGYRYRDDRRAYSVLPGDRFRHGHGPRIVSVGAAALRVPDASPGNASRFRQLGTPPAPSRGWRRSDHAAPAALRAEPGRSLGTAPAARQASPGFVGRSADTQGWRDRRGRDGDDRFDRRRDRDDNARFDRPVDRSRFVQPSAPAIITHGRQQPAAEADTRFQRAPLRDRRLQEQPQGQPQPRNTFRDGGRHNGGGQLRSQGQLRANGNGNGQPRVQGHGGGWR